MRELLGKLSLKYLYKKKKKREETEAEREREKRHFIIRPIPFFFLVVVEEDNKYKDARGGVGVSSCDGAYHTCTSRLVIRTHP